MSSLGGVLRITKGTTDLDIPSHGQRRNGRHKNQGNRRNGRPKSRRRRSLFRATILHLCTIRIIIVVLLLFRAATSWFVGIHQCFWNGQARATSRNKGCADIGAVSQGTNRLGKDITEPLTLVRNKGTCRQLIGTYYRTKVLQNDICNYSLLERQNGSDTKTQGRRRQRKNEKP
jgi:hypothetical protein